jgi:hypothetical protein
VKSQIKKNTILEYILNQFNDENATQEVTFVMGSEGLPLYKPISFEGAGGVPDEYEFFDEQTYQISKTQAVPISVPVIEAEYTNLRTLEGDKRIANTTFGVAVSFLVFANSYVHNKLVFAIEEFRDKMLGKIDILNYKQWDYSDTNAVPTNEYYTIVSSTGDIIPGDLLTINGDIFIEYTLQLSLDISEGIDYGNQFEFYIANSKTEGVYDFERILPLQVGFGTTNAMKGNQLLKNNNVLNDSQVSNHVKNKYKVIQNLVDTKSFSINMTLVKSHDASSIIENLFAETYSVFDVMNRPYQLQMKYRPIVDYNGIKTFGTAIEKFNYSLIPMEATTEFSHGDDIIFNITFVPSWLEV